MQSKHNNLVLLNKKNGTDNNIELIILSKYQPIPLFIHVYRCQLEKQFAYIPRIICNKKQSQQDIQIKQICVSDADHDYILDKIEHRGHIEYEIQIHNDYKQDFFINNKFHVFEVYMYVIQYINRNMSSKIYIFKCKLCIILLYYYIVSIRKGTIILKYTYINNIF